MRRCHRCLLAIWVSGCTTAAAHAAVDALGDPVPAGAVQRLGTLRLRFRGGVTDHCYLPDGRALVLIGTKVQTWDMTAGKRQAEHTVCDVGPVGMMLRPDNKALLFADSAGNVREWDLLEHRELRCWATNQKGLNAARYSPDAERVLTCGRLPPTVKEWDRKTGRELIAIKGGLAYSGTAVYAADGKTAWAGGGCEHTLEHYDLTTGKRLATLWKDYCIYTMTLSADGERLLVGSRHNGTEWRLADGKMLGKFTGHHGHAVPSIAYCRDPDHILTGSRDGSIRRWNRHRPKQYVARWWPHQGHVKRMRVSPDGEWVLSYGDNMLIETSVTDGSPRIRWDRHSGGVTCVAFVPLSGHVVSGSIDTTLRVWDVATGKTVHVIEGAKLGAFCVAVSPDGQRVAAGCKDGRVREFALADGKVLRELAGHRGWVRAVAYTGDGQRLLSSADDGSIAIGSTASDEPAARLQGHRGGVLAVAVSRDGKTAVSGGRDCTVRIWDLASAKQTHCIDAHRGWANAVALTPDGKRALSGGRDGRVVMWDVASGKRLAEMNHGAWVKAVACTPDGRSAWSGGDDGKIVRWDLRTGRKLRTSSGHEGPVLGLAVSSDGKRVASASADTTLLVWAGQ